MMLGALRLYVTATGTLAVAVSPVSEQQGVAALVVRTIEHLLQALLVNIMHQCNSQDTVLQHWDTLRLARAL